MQYKNISQKQAICNRFSGLSQKKSAIRHSICYFLNRFKPFTMKLFSFIFCIVSVTATAQSFDALMMRNQYVRCQDVNFNAARTISSLYEKNEIDSLYSFIDYWESKCGATSPSLTLRTLLDIKTANFDANAITETSFDYLFGISSPAPFATPFYSYIPPSTDDSQAFKNTQAEIRKIASDISETYSTDEALLVDFYKQETPSFKNIRQASSEESRLKQIHQSKLTAAEALIEGHIAFFVGYYHPFKKIELFGPHPSIGFMLGGRKFRHNLDLTVDVRFGPSKNEYEFVYKGTRYTNDKWTGVYAGLEYTYDFIQTKKFRAGISPGLGYNGITALSADNDYGEDSKVLPSYDANGGLVFKYQYGKKGGYVGLQTRYHWVDHRNAGGTELNGNYLSVRLIVGSIYNDWRAYKLKQLE